MCHEHDVGYSLLSLRTGFEGDGCEIEENARTRVTTTACVPEEFAHAIQDSQVLHVPRSTDVRTNGEDEVMASDGGKCICAPEETAGRSASSRNEGDAGICDLDCLGRGVCTGSRGMWLIWVII